MFPLASRGGVPSGETMAGDREAWPPPASPPAGRGKLARRPGGAHEGHVRGATDAPERDTRTPGVRGRSGHAQPATPASPAGVRLQQPRTYGTHPGGAGPAPTPCTMCKGTRTDPQRGAELPKPAGWRAGQAPPSNARRWGARTRNDSAPPTPCRTAYDPGQQAAGVEVVPEPENRGEGGVHS